MSIGQFQLQSAIYSALNVTAITTTLSCGVYDEVIEGNTYPFITLGEETTIDYSTKTETGGETTVNIHIWSRYKGSKQTKEIMATVSLSLSHLDAFSPNAFANNLHKVFLKGQNKQKK